MRVNTPSGLAGPIEFLENLRIGAKGIVPAFFAGKPPFTKILGLALPTAAADFPNDGFGVTLSDNFGVQAGPLQHLLHASFRCACLVF